MKKIYIGKSKVAGRGIFAGEDISRGEFVTYLSGKNIHKVFRTQTDLRTGKTWVSAAKKDEWIEPTFPIKYANHSCDANLGFKTPRRVYALRDIKRDAELTIDYSTIEYVDFWKIRCYCGSKKCRKWVTSIQFLPLSVFKSYLPYIPRYFQKIYINRNGRK